MNKGKLSSLPGQWVVILVCAALIIGAIAVVVALQRPEKVTNFDECIEAGGALMESYPEQCSYEGNTYMNEAQQVEGGAYEGMTEEDALERARDLSVPARVVERDGESLPVTMDFVHGRHNFHVRDGEVYRVEIEGESIDSTEPVE